MVQKPKMPSWVDMYLDGRAFRNRQISKNQLPRIGLEHIAEKLIAHSRPEIVLPSNSNFQDQLTDLAWCIANEPIGSNPYLEESLIFNQRVYHEQRFLELGQVATLVRYVGEDCILDFNRCGYTLQKNFIIGYVLSRPSAELDISFFSRCIGLKETGKKANEIYNEVIGGWDPKFTFSFYDESRSNVNLGYTAGVLLLAEVKPELRTFGISQVLLKYTFN